MKRKAMLSLSALLSLMAALGARGGVAPARVVEMKAPDGTLLKATYFAAAQPGPGVLLFHQGNRTRTSWDDVAGRLAAAGIHALTVDGRGHGESGGTHDTGSDLSRAETARNRGDDVDTALGYLAALAGVRRDVIGMGGAGGLGVQNAVEAARRHGADVKSLALLSGETLRPGLQFLHHSSQLPVLFVVADGDEYPPTAEAMELLYVSSSSPSKKLVHYSASADAPWLWYEPMDIGRVPASGNHGTDLFGTHPELPGIIVDWFVTTLIKTPGHAPADTVAAAAILDQIQLPGGAARATRQLIEARRTDPEAQLFPEITASIVGQDYLREGDTRSAIEVFELNLLAYPESADAHSDLAEACLKAGQADLARQHAERALALLDSHAAPASSWSDTEPRRGEVRRGVLQMLQKLGPAR